MFANSSNKKIIWHEEKNERQRDAEEKEQSVKQTNSMAKKKTIWYPFLVLV